MTVSVEGPAGQREQTIFMVTLTKSATSPTARQPGPVNRPRHATFDRYDVNRDGKVTVEEYTAGKTGVAKDMAEKRFRLIAKGKNWFTLDDLNAYYDSHKRGNAPR